MGLKRDAIVVFAQSHSKSETVRFALQLVGLDAGPEPVARTHKVGDEEIWRSTEEGKHYKFETETGEIKAGFGGKLNGFKLGKSFQEQRKAAAPKPVTPPSGGTSGGSSSSGGTSGGSTGAAGTSAPPQAQKPLPANMPEWARNLRDVPRQQLEGTMNRAEEMAKEAHKLQNLWKRGFLTQDEVEGRMRQQGLEGIDPDGTPEQNIMKMTNPLLRKSMISAMSEAKDWQHKAVEMAEQNWSERDKALAETLAVKYGIFTDDNGQRHDGIPDDVGAFGSWEQADLDCWYDLKSKAMGGPTSGRDAPDALQIAAGLKEAPKPQGPNYDWYNPDRGGSMDDLMASIVGEQVSYAHKWTKEEFVDVNQRFVDKLAYEKMNPNDLCYYGVKAVASMRDQVNGDNVYGQAVGQVKLEELNRLTDREKENLLNIMNNYDRMLHGSFSPVERYQNVEDLMYDDFRDVEKIMNRLNGNTIRSEAAQKPLRDYLLMQEKMLVGASPSTEEQRAEQARQKTEAEKEKHRQWVTLNRALTSEKRETFDRAKSELLSKLPGASTAEVQSALDESGIFQKYGVQLDGVHNTNAQEAAYSVEKVIDKFPFLYGEIRSINNKENGKSTYASCSMYDGQSVNLNASAEYFGSWESLDSKYRNDVERGFHPVGTSANAIVTHELGHSLDGWLSKNGVLGSKNSSGGKENFSCLLKKRVLKSLKIPLRNNKAQIEAGVSRYAAKNDHEWFAECFAEAMHSPNPRPMAKEMMRQLENILKEEGLMDA